MTITVLLTCAPDVSGHYRIEQPARALQTSGEDVDPIVAYNGLPMVFNHATSPSTYVGLATEFEEVDLVVLQRPMWYFMPDVIRDLQAKGIPVIVEIDDDFHAAHPDNRGFNQNHPRRSPEQNWHHLGKCVQLADHVIVSTDALARRYGSHGRCTVIRNYATDWWLDLPHLDKPSIGWTGSTKNHPTDPQAMGGVLRQILADWPGGWSFTVIGGEQAAGDTLRAFDLTDGPGVERVTMTPWKPIDLHPYLVSAGVGIGIVPLADTAFNAAKSWLKGLEFAALGIPFVASDLPEYRVLEAALESPGIRIAQKAKGWQRELRWFMTCGDDVRSETGAYNRVVVREHLTISKNAWRWAEVWQSVVQGGVRRAASSAR